jgi:hypothetical protein
MKRRRISPAVAAAIALVLVLSVVLAACGSSTKPKRADYLNAMVQSFDKQQNPLGLTPTQAKCFAGRFLDAIGVQFLADNNVTPAMFVSSINPLAKVRSKLSAAQVDRVTNSLFDGHCFQTEVLVAGTFRSVFPKLTAAKRLCLAKGVLARKEFHAYLASGLLGDTSPANPFAANTTALISVLETCKISPAEIQ